MAVDPKINTEEDIAKLSKCYLTDKMSTVDIEKESKEIFGQYISRGTIYRSLVKHKINVRNKSVSVSRAMSTLDVDQILETEEVIGWVDGLMLGDGGINFKTGRHYQGSRYVIGTTSKQWADFAMRELQMYNPLDSFISRGIDKKHPNETWSSQTKTHPDIIKQAQRWYSGPKESKVVPEDVRITPESVLLWYLGDGSFTYNKTSNSSQLRLATCSFDEDQLDILVRKLEEHNIKSTIYRSKIDIHICSHSIKDFFNFIGWESPFSDYDHKFAVPEWLKLYRLSEIVENDREKWRVQSWCKTGKVEHSRSPNGRFLLFSKDQAEKIQNKLR
jgi:hypothetical protein